MAALRRVSATAGPPSHPTGSQATRPHQIPGIIGWGSLRLTTCAEQSVQCTRTVARCCATRGRGPRSTRVLFLGRKMQPCRRVPASLPTPQPVIINAGGWRSLTLLAPGLVPRGGVHFVGPRTISPAPGFRLSRAGVADAATPMASLWMEAERADQTGTFSAASHGPGTRNGRSSVTLTVKAGPSSPKTVPVGTCGC